MPRRPRNAPTPPIAATPSDPTHIGGLTPDPHNARRHTPRNIGAIVDSLQAHGAGRSIVIDENNVVLAGNGLIEAAGQAGIQRLRVIDADGSEIIAVRRRGLTDAQKASLAIADNRTAELAGWDGAELLRQITAHDLNMGDLGFTPQDMADIRAADALAAQAAAAADGGGTPGDTSLAGSFIVPPFSVLDARQGYWQDRKRAWIATGIASDSGRGGDLMFHDGIDRMHGAPEAETSIFDPVLAEIACHWFAPPGGFVLDPFAGGSVRGIVASKLGRCYHGIDLSRTQVDANYTQAGRLCAGVMPTWTVGDSRDVLGAACEHPAQYDLVFSCPPYADLEIYSDDPRDLSAMPYPDFLAAYQDIIAKAVRCLKDDRFAVWVVGDVRDMEGNYRNLPGDTVAAFIDAGLRIYNEAILVSPLGTLPSRAGNPFVTSRKLGKGHQNVYVFVKGDGRRAADACGTITVQCEPTATAAT